MDIEFPDEMEVTTNWLIQEVDDVSSEDEDGVEMDSDSYSDSTDDEEDLYGDDQEDQEDKGL